MRLDGRVAIVTGAGRGIGAATARELVRLGAAVVVNDVDEAAARLGVVRIRRQRGYMTKTERIVGIRELRDCLSAYLQLVANGQSLTIGNRRNPVARLVPAAATREADAHDRLAAAGVIQRASGRPGARGAVKPRKRSRRSTSDLVREDRR